MACTIFWPLERGILVWCDWIRFGTDIPEAL